MAEFPWSNLFRLPEKETRSRESLPPAPAGMEWVLDGGSSEWKLAKKRETTTSAAAEPSPPKQQQHPPVPISPDARPKPKTTITRYVDTLPPRDNNNNNSSCHNSSSCRMSSEEDWEFLSDRHSAASTARRTATSGSVRSINEQHAAATAGAASSSHTTLSLPFKIQRTASSSTIDSSDNALGPSGKGVLGVDYVEHVILPTDTLQGICLEYKVSSTKLRQANHFSGNSLLLAPKKLVIPISKTALRSGFIRVQDTASKEYKLHAFLAEFTECGVAEAKAYLELADWDLKDAFRSARDDVEWEQDMDGCNSWRSGEIRITPHLQNGIPCGFATVGAGLPQARKAKVTPVQDIPAIATKTVRAQDVYLAAPQHSNFGVELQPMQGNKKIG